MNRKGFTLTELLVVVVILGIISGLSIPLIRNLTTSFETKKYQNYADSVLAASKVYNDSYSEDLFGRNEYGCAYIPYEKLAEKNLIKDIQIDKKTCNSEKTYVRVMKQQDKYGYAVYLTCGDEIKGKLNKVTISIPNNIPEMNNAACTGVDESNLLISLVDAQTGGKKDKNRKKAKLKIESGTGINNNVIIYAKWSMDENDHTTSGFEKIDFKVKSNQEKSILNGEMISTISDELVSPQLTGKYYLIVRVDRLEDLYGHSWKNPTTPDSKYLTFGPFMLDSTGPIMKIDVYKCNSNSNKTGDVLATKTHTGDANKTGDATKFDLSDMTGTVSGWATSKNFPYGACFVFNVSDESSLNNSTWQWNATLFKASDTNYKTFPEDNKTVTEHSEKTTATFNKSLTVNGHRYAKMTTKDLAGNKTEVFIDLKLDNKGPDEIKIYNDDNNKWIKKDASVTIESKDENDINAIGDYYYSYKQDATDYTGTTDADAATKWVKISGGTGKKSFTAKVWTTTMNKVVYIKTTDAVENISSVTKNTIIKIDKSKPIVEITNNSDEWHNTDVTLKLSARDNTSGIEESGIDEYYYSYKQDATDYTGTTDADAATKWVKLSGGTEKTSFTTQALWKTTMNKAVYIRVKDKVGNYSDVVSTRIKIDKNPPSVPTLCSSKHPNSWGKSIIHTLSSEDNTSGFEESGVNKFQYKYEGINWTDSTSNVTTGSSEDDIWGAHTDPGDSSSGTSSFCNQMAALGISCPESTSHGSDDDLISSGHSSSGSINSSIYGFLATSSNSVESTSSEECEMFNFLGTECTMPATHGHETFSYEACPIVDEGTNTIHRHNFTSPTGTNIIYWRACDNAGNCSDSVSTTMKIDRTSPKCSSSHSGTTVTFSCTDNLSGCRESTYSTEDPNGDGVSHTFYDNAGNSVRCGKEAGEPEEDDDEGGGGGYSGGGDENCTYYDCSSHVYQGGGSQSASSCNSSCGEFGGFITGEGTSGATYVSVSGGGGYWKCTAFADGQVGAGMGCCNCKDNCKSTCDD